jgi:hypothetical protein
MSNPAARLRRVCNRLSALALLLSDATAAPGPPPSIDHAVAELEGRALLLEGLLQPGKLAEGTTEQRRGRRMF